MYVILYHTLLVCQLEGTSVCNIIYHTLLVCQLEGTSVCNNIPYTVGVSTRRYYTSTSTVDIDILEIMSILLCCIFFDASQECFKRVLVVLRYWRQRDGSMKGMTAENV